MAKIKVLDQDITLIRIKDEDFISLTDMLKAKDGEFFISDWLRNRNTIEYLGIWEKIHNPDFNYGEYATITSKAGRYGGTYTHKDIAFEFKIYLIKEFRRLKERVQKLNKVAISQMKILLDDKTIKKLESK